MNILHHKSWHVRNKNNIAKVRAAEKKAREEEEAKEKRKLIAESEARVNLLRVKARSGNSTRGEDATISSIAAILDGREPSSVGEDRQNVDHEKEAKKDKEDWEKKVGILTYLGQGCNEDNPWYLLDHNTRMNLKQDVVPSTSGSLNKPKSYLKNDPLIDIERHLATMKKNKAKETPSIPPPKVISSPPAVIAKVKKEVDSPQIEKKKDKKSKRSKHKRNKSRQKKRSKKSRSSTPSESESSSSSDVSSSSDDDNLEAEKRAKLEALRAERLRREKAERERAKRLLDKSIQPEPKIELDDRKRSYNSQFNPHLARQNLDKPN